MCLHEEVFFLVELFGEQLTWKQFLANVIIAGAAWALAVGLFAWAYFSLPNDTLGGPIPLTNIVPIMLLSFALIAVKYRFLASSNP